MHVVFWLEYAKVRDRLEDLDVGGKIILECGKVTGYIWFRTGKSCGLL